ncbi:MAG: hypothetical protein C4340_06235 [Armatimonadota bacterium]
MLLGQQRMLRVRKPNLRLPECLLLPAGAFRKSMREEKQRLLLDVQQRDVRMLRLLLLRESLPLRIPVLIQSMWDKQVLKE